MKNMLAAFLAVFLCLPAHAQVGADEAWFAGPAVHTVTNCDDSGPGSLRDTLVGTSGKRHVEFSVSCDLTLLSAITANVGDVWVRGETAPAPGFTIRGFPLELKRGAMKISHLRFRTGTNPAWPAGQDSISVTGATPSGSDCTGQRDMSNIMLDHVSASWSQDEVIQFWGCNIANITVSNSIIAEGLNNTGHPSGEHSMGLYIGPGVRDALVHRNLFVSNEYRNPVIHGGATAAVINNIVHNSGDSAIHIYADSNFTAPTVVAMIGNLITEGPDSRNRQRIGNGTGQAVNVGTQVYLEGNLQENVSALDVESVPNATLVGTNPLTLPAGLNVVSAYSLETTLVNCADPAQSDVGAQHKDATDLRLISEFCARGGSIKDTPPAGE